MTGKVFLIFGCHCHQPVGNFDEVIERICSESYFPFLQVAAQHPRIKIVLHYSGALLEWIEKKHPEFFEILNHMVQTGQAELLSGSFYEAILAVIPENDQAEQVRRLTSFIQDKLKTTPRGMWLAERIWEPKLAKTLASSGMEFSLVDDFHFKAAGLEQENLWDYFRVEEEGRYVSLFPICEKLRYLTPFQEVSKSINYLKLAAEKRQNPLLVIVDDGEKFGSWPGTKKWVYGEGWLEKFFRALEENCDWIETIHCSEYMKRFSPGRLMYLPIGSYFEMGEWSLLADRAVGYEKLTAKLQEQGVWEEAKGFFKGGIWRNFFLKYPESNHMHKKMLALSTALEQLRTEKEKNPEAEKLWEAARTHLLRSQCNDAYWHGVFGGLYLPHLRQEIWRSLIRAERTLDKFFHPQEDCWTDSSIGDIDGDGREEITMSNPLLTACFDPSEGGMMVELDIKPLGFNLLNTLARRFEAYHRNIEKSEAEVGAGDNSESVSIHDLDKSEAARKHHGRLAFDRNRRCSLIDHFMDKKTGLDQVKNEDYTELGDFAAGEYEYNLDSAESQPVLTLAREGQIDHGGIFPFRLVKTVRMMYNQGLIKIAYELENRSDKPLDFLFGVEMNFALLSGQSPEIYLHFPGSDGLTWPPASSGDRPGINNVQITDRISGFLLDLQTEPAAGIWWFPVETVSQSERGYDLTYQSTVILPRWELGINAGDRWKASLKLSVLPLAPFAPFESKGRYE